MNHQCELCGADTAVENLSIDGYCDLCVSEIEQANADFKSRPAVNWKRFFAEESSSAALDSFYSGYRR